MINVNSLKSGITFKTKEGVFLVLDAQHSKQGRGQASVKTKVKNLLTGAIIIKTFTGGERVEKAFIDYKEMSFLYIDGQNVILMDKTTFEQMSISAQKVKWELNFLKEGDDVKIRMYEGQILDIELMPDVKLKIIEDPGSDKGNSSSNPQKRVKVETGYELDVPVFVKLGDLIIISTLDGKYKGRG